MSDFELFNKALNVYVNLNKNISNMNISDDPNGIYQIKNINKVVNENTGEKINNCEHNNIINDNDSNICSDCGEVMIRIIKHEKEWRYYGQSDSRHTSDPTRVQQRKCDERTIFKDVENMGFSDKIVVSANEIYMQVTNNQIYRGDSRKAIIFASIFHAYKLSGKPQNHEKLISIFNLNRKTGLRGLKHVNLYAPKDSKIRTTYITPINLVEDIMEIFSATKEQIQEVINIYELIKNKSSRLNRSRPKSVSSGIVYYWVCLKGKEITLKDFAKKVELSELTIQKIALEIANVLNTPNVI
jgi:transcription initiation factor TFIIIB Brf1 subunit/transcription initiation factor TFIIB